MKRYHTERIKNMNKGIFKKFYIFVILVLILYMPLKAEAAVDKQELQIGQVLKVNEKLYSSNKAYYMMLQTDGNLGVFRTQDNVPIYAVFSASMAQADDYYAKLQADGNFAIYDGNHKLIWYTNYNGVGITNQNGINNIVLVSDDGKLKVMSDKECLWSSDVKLPPNLLRTNIVDFAKQYVGYPYVYGGNSLTQGVDCSGFVKCVYEHFGYHLSRTSASQYNDGIHIAREQLNLGDLVFYASGQNISHVAIYIGNGQIIHAANEEYGIIITSITWPGTPYGYCKIVD